MSAPTITLYHTGYIVEGESILSMWGGGEGTIDMKPCYIPKDKLSKTSLLECVNDAMFGCKSILGATIHIYDDYEGNVQVYRKTIILDPNYCKIYQGLFNNGIGKYIRGS